MPSDPRVSFGVAAAVVRDGKVVSNELGVNKWEDTLTRIRTLLA